MTTPAEPGAPAPDGPATGRPAPGPQGPRTRPQPETTRPAESYGQPTYPQPQPGYPAPPVWSPQPGYAQPGYAPPGYAPPGYGYAPQQGQHPPYGHPAAYPQQPFPADLRRPPVRVSAPPVGWALLVLAVLGCIGSAGTWASVDVFGLHATVSGTGHGKDGTITIVLMILVGVAGLLIGLGQGRLWVPIVALVLAALTTLTAIADIGDISNGIDGAPDSAVSVGWGLWLTLAAGVLAAAASVVALLRRS